MSNDTPPIDLDHLETLARAATPGPWRWGDWDATFGTAELPERMLVLEFNPTRRADQAPCVRLRGDGARMVLRLEEPVQFESNAAYIAAANPATVLALVKELRAARAVADRLRSLAEGLQCCDNDGSRACTHCAEIRAVLRWVDATAAARGR